MANNPANFVDADGRTAVAALVGCEPPGVNLPSTFGIVQSVFAVKNLIDNIKAVKSMAISNGAHIMNSHAASLINQVATGMMARGVADGVSGQDQQNEVTSNGSDRFEAIYSQLSNQFKAAWEKSFLQKKDKITSREYGGTIVIKKSEPEKFIIINEAPGTKEHLIQIMRQGWTTKRK
jgi:hypothetical protein